MGAVGLFNHPVVATLLLALAFLGLFVEVRSEGFRRAGWAGLLALGLFVASHLIEGTPAWTALPVVLGVAVLWPSLEDPGRRAVAVVGSSLVAVGAYAVMVAPGPAHLDHARAAAVLVSAGLLVALAATVVWWRLPATERPVSRLGVLLPPPRADADEAAGAPGDRAPSRGEGAGAGGGRGLLGERGRAVSPLRPAGWAVVRGERIEVVSDGEWVEEGDDVEVVGDEGVRPRVRRAPGPRTPRSGLDAGPADR